MAGETIQYQLGPAYAKFTGLLNNVYPTKEGVVTVPVDSEKKAGRILETHYGAKKISAPGEAASVKDQLKAALEAKAKAEADAKAALAAKADAEAKLKAASGAGQTGELKK